MSGRHAGQSATRKRFVRIATVSAVAAVPLGVAVAGSASADSGPLPVDTSSVTGLLSPVTGILGGDTNAVADNGGITNAVSNALSGTPAGGVLSTVTGAASGTPAAGVLSMVSGSAPAAAAQSAVADSPAGGLLSTVTGATSNTPVAGVLSTVTGTATHGLSSGNPVDGLGGVVSGLGLQGVTDTLKPVTDTVNGLVNPLLGNGGLLGGLTGGLLGGLLGGNQPGDHTVAGEHTSYDPSDDAENTALPHTGGNSDMTALLLCSGLGLAGAGVTLVARRRGGIGA